MYKKFIINSKEIVTLDEPTGQMPVRVSKEDIRMQLVSYLLDSKVEMGTIKAKSITSIFYPLRNSQVFISHSGQDKDIAVKLANWLWSNFKIESFIDSLFWGELPFLQRTMDEKICTQFDKGTWSYKDRNYSTSYVHMMLSNTLSEMIKSCECFIFIDSNNSISYDPVDFEKDTSSPWIFHELYTVNTIQPIIPERLVKHDESLECFNESIEKAMRFDVTKEVFGLQPLYRKDLLDWSTLSKGKKSNDALDDLYDKKLKVNQKIDKTLYEGVYNL